MIRKALLVWWKYLVFDWQVFATLLGVILLLVMFDLSGYASIVIGCLITLLIHELVLAIRNIRLRGYEEVINSITKW